ncbi:hypothetical protein QZR14_12025 [Pseudomonas sp. rhizo66]|uniref:hypothetical protein n=1 Tax=unclassified Pseudomonas TaxID=196821 RepID=UPI00202A13A4|nr:MULTISPECIES: hypothetical protein [unclassified Pseudomonas]MCL9802953.1 hypothetical protein [Pseudomonas sp. AKS31]MDT3312079.1 hypothetical protein [Pseudomonas sp. rhizo66]
MNKRMIAIGLASLVSLCPLFSLAAEKTGGSSAPPTVMPGVNQGGSESKEDKADKKGEEASGSNSGAEAHETQKDAASSSDSADVKKPSQ